MNRVPVLTTCWQCFIRPLEKVAIVRTVAATLVARFMILRNIKMMVEWLTNPGDRL